MGFIVKLLTISKLNLTKLFTRHFVFVNNNNREIAFNRHSTEQKLLYYSSREIENDRPALSSKTNQVI